MGSTICTVPEFATDRQNFVSIPAVSMTLAAHMDGSQSVTQYPETQHFYSACSAAAAEAACSAARMNLQAAKATCCEYCTSGTKY